MLTRLRNINFAIIARFIGWLVIIEGIFMLAPLLICHYDGSFFDDGNYVYIYGVIALQSI